MYSKMFRIGNEEVVYFNEEKSKDFIQRNLNDTQ